ncbi:MAG TPA: class I SAM-dependent methyltransferase [Candidatus Dormibacteraeota bacterium]
MKRIVDNPRRPDPAFAEAYARLPDATQLEPWLSWCRAAQPPVLYLGIGAGRLAVPLAAAGVEMVGVDAHPGMLEIVARRLPGIELHRSLIADLDLGRRFDLVIGPSSVLGSRSHLRAAARHLRSGGRVGFELMNPHWLLSGATPGVRILERRGDRVRMEVDYPGGYVQLAAGSLQWPERIEGLLKGTGLRLVRLDGGPALATSPTYTVLTELSSLTAC